MKWLLVMITLIAALFCSPLIAEEEESVRMAAKNHLLQQLPPENSRYDISIGRIPVSRLPACTQLEAFTPSGAALVGKTQVGVRCLAPHPWTVRVPAQIAVIGNYLTAKRPLLAGQVLQADDLAIVIGDISRQPAGICRTAETAIGKVLRNTVAAGQAIHAQQLTSPILVRAGETVRVISIGEGFAVSAEGKALGNGAAGQAVQIRMSNGQIIRGKVQEDGSVSTWF